MASRGWGYSTASPRCSCHGHPTPTFPFPCTVWNGLLTIKELGLALPQPQSLFVWGGGCWPLGPRVLARHPQAGLLPALLLKVPKWCRSHRVTGLCGSPLPHSSPMGALPASGGCRAQPPGSSHVAENTRVTHAHMPQPGWVSPRPCPAARCGTQAPWTPCSSSPPSSASSSVAAAGHHPQSPPSGHALGGRAPSPHPRVQDPCLTPGTSVPGQDTDMEGAARDHPPALGGHSPLHHMPMVGPP